MEPFVAVDLETTALSPREGEIFSYSLCWPEGSVEINRVDGKDGKDPERQWDRLQEIFDDTSIRKVAHNAKFEQSFINKSRIVVPAGTIWHDTMIQHQLLRNLAPAHGLDDLVWEFGGDFGGEYKKIDATIKQYSRVVANYSKIPVHLMHRYQVADAERGALLHLLLFPYIQADPKLHADYLMEMELIHVTERIEDHGIMIDKRNCNDLIKWLRSGIESVEVELYNMFGEFINPRSPDQVRRILFKRLGYPILKLTDSKQSSVDKHVIEILRTHKPHPFLDLLIKYRSYSTGITTIEKYLRIADANDLIHTNVKQNGADTGRESSDNPPMQNVSKKAALKNPFPVPARKCFRAPPGHVLLMGDYSGEEMRLIADRAGEDEFIALINQNGDPHALAASLFYGGKLVPDNMKWDRIQGDKFIRKMLRDAAKNAQFALAYGAATPKIATVLMLSPEQADEGVEAYRKRFPKVAGFTRSLVHQVTEKGFIETAFGRKLWIPRDTPYMASNYMIQGTGAGILKRAQIKVDEYLQREWGDQVRIVMPIHDELIFSYPRSLFPQQHIIIPKLAQLMTEMPEIRVRLDTEWKMTTTTWDAAKEYKLVA